VKLTRRQEKMLRRTFIDYTQTSEFLKSPLLLHKAEGLYYWDVAGKRYFDAIGAIFVAVLCGFDNEFAHADHEFVRIENLLQPCKVALLAALNYLELEEVRI
jgi:4-aminobutyrate aminotransferase-like enzyme